MTPIFLVVLLAIDPIIAQNSGPPTILVKPQSLQVKAGGIASFYCTAEGAPSPQIHWRKNGKKISQSQSRYVVHYYPNGALLRIEPVKPARDNTNYECLAENGVGDAVSAEATLTGYEPDHLPTGFPMITQAPTTKVVEMGHMAVLHCAAVGSPTPIISWVRDMMPIDTTNPRYTVLDSGTLQITESDVGDQGKYECVANNSVGTEYSKSTSLYVKVRRVAPTFSIPPPSVSEVMLGASLNLTCVAVGAPMPFVKWKKDPATDLTPDDNLPVGKNVLMLTDIQESANYTCTAASDLGVIETTTMVKVQSLPGPPENVQVSDITATSVKLSWSYKGPDELQYYVIQHKPKHVNQAFAEISGITTMYYHVRSLSPYTEYELYVIAVNSIGRGPPSAPVIVTTGETTESTNGGAKPGTAPRKVQVRPLSSSTMVIQWDEPETPNGQVTGYKVYYTTDSNQPMASWQYQMVDNSQLTTISELTPHTIYTIRVQALTSVGPGPLSLPVQIKTQQGVPSQPEMLTAVDIGETKVTLQWSKPAHSAENILSYELYWNDTYAKEKHHRRIPVTENYTLAGLYPNTLYYVWLAARSQRGEGATTIPYPVRTKQYALRREKMDIPNSALLLHSSIYKNPSALTRGSSGIWISRDWILTHGTALSSIIDKHHAISNFFRNMLSGKLTMVPQELTNQLTFQVYCDLGMDNISGSNNRTRVQEHSGFIAAAWKCRLLSKTFDEFFDTELWSFPKLSTEFDQLLHSVFLLVRVFDYNEPFVEISMAEQALSRLSDQTLQDPVRGTSVEIVSTPFCNSMFIDSIARGVISNVVGDESCVIMTDAFAFPGGEGGPVYVISSDCKRRNIIGMVIAPLSWCRGEWVDYTFAANLAPCLLDILQKQNTRFLNYIYHEERETLDRSVVLVRCGINWGTGVLVDKSTGTFLTCSHVVAEAPERDISIVMRTDKFNSRVSAKLLYKTPDNQPYDVAILQIHLQDMDPSLKAIRLSHDPILKGEPVVSIGFPFSSSIRPTISSGVVSKTTDWAILTTCCTQSGISGGPIVSQATGEMLGMIVCNALSSDGTVLYPRISLAVPATALNGPLREYLRTGNPDVFRAFTCDDALAHKIWDFQPHLPSKL